MNHNINHRAGGIVRPLKPMKLSQQVCSLELAKKLKELDVKQDTHLWWLFWDDGHGEGEKATIIHNRASAGVWEITERDKVGECISAFSVAELGDILPRYLFSAQLGHKWKWTCGKWSAGEAKLQQAEIPFQYGDTEADARAKMLIYLLENKLITLS